MNKLIYISLLTVFFLESSTAQVSNPSGRRVIFQGIVRDASQLFPLQNSQIFINKSYISSTDSAGSFTLFVNRKDTLEFRMLGYKPVFLLVNDTLPGREYMAGVFLHSDTINIGEVIIIPRLAKLKSDLLNPRQPLSQEEENARNNLAIAAYQAKVTTGNLGDPLSNYEIIRQQHRNEAYEKGQIPSSRMVGISPLIIVPALYLMINGLPQQPAPAKSDLTGEEINQIQKRYLESVRKKQ